MQERRKEGRWRTYLGGRATFMRGQSTADVLVRNMSTSGARLVIHNGRFVPDRFNLTVPQWHREVRATTRWRHEDQMGIEFEQLRPAEAPTPISFVRRIKQLEAKNAELKRRISELSE